MEINFKSLQPKISTDSEKQDKVCDTPVEKTSETTEAKVYPDASVMRAYASVKPSETTVSKQEALEFIHSNIIKSDKFDEKFLNILTDSDGYVKTETLDIVRNASNKFKIMDLIENSKENGKINHKLLKILEQALPELEKKFREYDDVPNYLKDKNGRFDNDSIEILGNVVNENPKNAYNFITVFSRAYLTSDKEFDKNAIAYHKEQGTNKELNKILNDIYYGKDENGKFSKDRLEAYNELSPHLESWQASNVLNLLEQADDKKEFIELAKNLKTDEDLQKIFKFVCDIKQSKNNKTEIGFDKNSVEFIKKLKNESFLKEAIPSVLTKINIPYTDYTQENIDTVRKLLTSVYDQKDIETILDAAVYKAGDKKGQFSFENLDKYIDIYNNSAKSISEINFISNVLSLETDDYALDTINKLYGLSWENETRYGTHTEKLNKKALQMVFKLSTLSKNNVPTRKMYRPMLDNLNKLMSMHLPMTSAGAFQKFMIIPDFDIIEKLERVKLDEIGINTDDMTNKSIQEASEEDLFAFKDFMIDYVKDKNPKYVEVNLNTNIKDIVEITYNNQSILYNMVERKPVATRNDNCGYEVELNDTEKNINVKQIFSEKNGEKHLYRQIVEKHDKDGNLLYTEKMERSEVEGVYNVVKTYPDGRVEDIVKAQKTKDGNTLVEKNLTSPEGVKTYYRYEDDVTGNRIMDYKIVDTDGKVLMDQSSTFEVLDENHFITSRNKKSYDIKFNTDSIEVKNIQSGETRTIDIVEFTGGTQDNIVPLLKKIPGDELFKMKEINLKSLSLNNNYDNAAFSPKAEAIGISQKYLEAGVLLHELGHAKDEMAFKEISEEIVNDPSLVADYQKEKAAAREFHSEAELDHLSYFGADYHYLGDKKLKEGIAESNMILDVLPQHEVNSIRAHYWMQDFPRVIAKLSNLLY